MNNKKYIIEKDEISKIIKNSNNKIIFITKHGCFSGKKDFAFNIVENILIELYKKENKINDENLIEYAKIINTLCSNKVNEFYKKILKKKAPNNLIYRYGLYTLKDNNTYLTNKEKRHFLTISEQILSDYLFLGDYQKVDYQALKLIISTIYILLILNLDINYRFVDIIIDIGNCLEQIIINENNENYNIDDDIIVKFDLINKIEGYYWSYKSEYPGLEESSFLELASANLAEKFFLSDERFPGSYSMLTKQYCSILEIEINKLIQILNLTNNPNKHLMWNDMKKYIKNNNIELCFKINGENLYEILNKLHPLRNKSSHGEKISQEEYQLLCYYKNDLFFYISQTKLIKKNIIIHPTVKEIQNYFKK